MSEIMHAVRVKSPDYMNRYYRRMFTVLTGTGVVLFLARDTVYYVLQSNLIMNGMIATVLMVGISICFRNLYRLKCDLRALCDLDTILFESRDAQALLNYNSKMFIMSDLYKSLENSTKETGEIPEIPTPVARSMVNIANNRFDERRIRISYFVNLLIYLGLLGTFIGLSATVGSISGMISKLAMGLTGEQEITDTLIFLIRHLEQPLSGMGTAFGTSLTGLASSVVLGALAMSVNKASTLFSNSYSNWIYEYAMTSFTAGIEKHSNKLKGSDETGAVSHSPAYSPKSEQALVNIEQHMQNLLSSQQTLLESHEKQLSTLLKIHKRTQSDNQAVLESLEKQSSTLSGIHDHTNSHNQSLDSIQQTLTRHEPEAMQTTVKEACGQLTDMMSSANDELQKQTRLINEQNTRQDSQNNESGAQRQRMIQSQLASVKLMKKQVESAEALYQQSQQLPDAFATAASNRLKETEQALAEQIHAGQDELGKTIEKAQSVHRDLLLRLFKALHRLYRICLPGNR
ncbi:hypothetical protein NX722_08130 [Endozoicomonas gorgoniicola]|uniref:MotA/TolQ/ExbB proton channel domain-containing protein n=1 Tax=Endozoicomonas gorgoniicola TaxID=1234144 RepID=A0ABT3MTC2_9GAMM|nr:hypothetical protein [Endozoicomonas gorgoniicola]MCW7552618.1 hypothetical protein [Endozoicomonas gorgoniicola]